MMQLPLLYKATKTGATQLCNITSEGDTFTVEFGQLGGKLQSKSTKCFTTNAGRANERNPEQQSIFEAQAKWQKKVDTGYTTHLPSDAPSDFSAINLPQKVKVFQEQLHNVADHVFISDKLNGINGLYRLDNDVLTLYSRGGLPYPELPHLTSDITHLMVPNKLTSLNVELYTHGEHLQNIQSAVTKPNELSPRIQARIFELPDEPGTYAEHQIKLKYISGHYATPMVSVIPSVLVSKLLIESMYNDAMSRGCEGLIIRNPTGVYKYNERSSDVFKYKKTMDAEFRIIGHKLDKNNHPVFQCITDSGSFSVKPKGTNEQRDYMREHINEYIGQYYKIEFECYSKSGIPTKPVGVALRKMSADGEPLE